jgi:hypothetical protein
MDSQGLVSASHGRDFSYYDFLICTTKKIRIGMPLAMGDEIPYGGHR